MDIQQVQKKLAQFAATRDWDRFHSPKNLCMALVGEVGELTEHFQWITEEQSRQLGADSKRAVGEEIADVLIYTIRLADKLGIDVDRAVRRKMKMNAKKYPATLARIVKTSD